MTTEINRHLESLEFQRLYAEEGFINEALERLCVWMEEHKISRAELARLLGTSRSNVTQLLRGRNVGLRTLAAAIHVMGGRPVLTIEPLVHMAPSQPMTQLTVWTNGLDGPQYRIVPRERGVGYGQCLDAAEKVA